MKGNIIAEIPSKIAILTSGDISFIFETKSPLLFLIRKILDFLPLVMNRIKRSTEADIRI
jgi:hypothetical protein